MCMTALMFVLSSPIYLYCGRFASGTTGEHFDLVASLEVIEHVDDAPGFVSSLAGLTRPGGMLTLSTINRTAKVREARVPF